MGTIECARRDTRRVHDKRAVPVPRMSLARSRRESLSWTRTRARSARAIHTPGRLLGPEIATAPRDRVPAEYRGETYHLRGWSPRTAGAAPFLHARAPLSRRTSHREYGGAAYAGRRRGAARRDSRRRGPVVALFSPRANVSYIYIYLHLYLGRSWSPGGGGATPSSRARPRQISLTPRSTTLILLLSHSFVSFRTTPRED